MSLETLLSLCGGLEENDISVWFDGGWGVDALLGVQTREHGDVDIVVEEKDVPALLSYLKTKEYAEIKKDDSTDWNFVLGDKFGNEIDVHVINIDAFGDGIYGPPENKKFYPKAALVGVGFIDGHSIRCVTAEYQIASRSGYELRDKDYQDIENLRNKFNL